MTTAKKTGATKKAAPLKAAAKPAGRLPATVAVSTDVPTQSVRADGSVVLYTPPVENDPAKRGRSGVAIDSTTAGG